MVYQDNVINIYLPNDLRKLLDDYFSRLKNMGEIDFNYLIQNIFEKECQIKVIVNKDAELAAQIKKQLLSRFKGK